MSTYLEVRNKIRADLKVSSSGISNDIINDCIQRAIKYHETNRFWFNNKVSDITIDNEYVDLPTDFIEPLTISFYVNGASYILQPTSYDDIEISYSTSDISQPTHYTIVGSQLRIYPIPNQTYSGKIYYIYQLAQLSDDNDTNEWITGAESLIKAGAKKYIYGEHIFNKDMMAIMESVEFNCLTHLKNRTFRHNKNRTIKGSDI